MCIATHEMCKICGDIRLIDDLNDEGICDICAEVDPINYCCEADVPATVKSSN